MRFWLLFWLLQSGDLRSHFSAARVMGTERALEAYFCSSGNQSLPNKERLLEERKMRST